MNHQALPLRFHTGNQTSAGDEFLLRGADEFFWHCDPD